MKTIILSTLFIIAFTFSAYTQNVGIGTITPTSSAKLDISSTTQGFLPPRMTTAQRNAITSPAAGLTIFNTSTNCINYYQGSEWQDPCLQMAAIMGRQKLDSLFGGNNSDFAESIQQTADGGYIIAGGSNSSASGNVTGTTHGGYDCWIVKLDASGNISWNKLLGGTGDDIAYEVQQTTDGGYIVVVWTNSSASGDVSGTNHGGYDYWVVKLDASGNITWNKLIGGSGSEQPSSIHQTADGGYIVAGQSNSSASSDVTGTSHGVYEYWIVKLDASGNIVWNKLLGGSANEVLPIARQTSDGGYIVAGESNSSASGDVTGTNHGGYDWWIVKLDASGNITWNKLLGGALHEYPSSIEQTADDGYIVAGFSSSSTSGDVTGTNNGNGDYWIVKLDPSGTIVWNALYGGSSQDEATSIRQTTDGGYIVAGSSNSSASGNVTGTNKGINDYWIIKLNSAGSLLWNKLIGGSGDENASSIQQTADGGYIVGGYSTSSAFGDVIGTNHGNNDCWIVKLNALGSIVK